MATNKIFEQNNIQSRRSSAASTNIGFEIVLEVVEMVIIVRRLY